MDFKIIDLSRTPTKLSSSMLTGLPHNDDRPQLRRKTASGQTGLPPLPQGSRPVLSVWEHRRRIAELGNSIQQQLQNEAKPAS